MKRNEPDVRQVLEKCKARAESIKRNAGGTRESRMDDSVRCLLVWLETLPDCKSICFQDDFSEGNSDHCPDYYCCGIDPQHLLNTDSDLKTLIDCCLHYKIITVSNLNSKNRFYLAVQMEGIFIGLDSELASICEKGRDFRDWPRDIGPSCYPLTLSDFQ